MGKVTVGNAKSSNIVQATAVAPQIITQFIEKIVEVPVEKIITKEVEKIVNIPVETIVEKIVEVEKLVSVPYEVIKEVIVEKLILDSELLDIEVERIDKLIEQTDSDLKLVKQKLEVNLDLAKQEIVKLQLDLVKEQKSLNIKLIIIMLASLLVAILIKR